jgi:hypothetical protein
VVNYKEKRFTLAYGYGGYQYQVVASEVRASWWKIAKKQTCVGGGKRIQPIL